MERQASTATTHTPFPTPPTNHQALDGDDDKGGDDDDVDGDGPEVNKVFSVLLCC